MKRHVSCFVEKAGFEPRTLGTKAERYDHCATRMVDYNPYLYTRGRDATPAKPNQIPTIATGLSRPRLEHLAVLTSH